MPSRILRTNDDREIYIRYLRNQKLPHSVEDTPGADRTIEQNKLQFLWLNEAAEQRGDVTSSEVRHEWKLRFGIPILRRDSDRFRDKYDRIIKPLPYSAKLEAMEWFPVTSLMKVRQMVEYLDTVMRESAQQGIVLTEPDPDLAKYHARYRAEAQKEAA